MLSSSCPYIHFLDKDLTLRSSTELTSKTKVTDSTQLYCATMKPVSS